VIPSPGVTATVLPVATRALLEACGRLGLDPAAIAARAGLPGPRLDDPDARLPADVADAVWREAWAASGDPALALRAAEATPFGAFRVLDFLGATGATVGEGLARVAAYFPLVDPRGAFAVERSPGAVSVSFRSLLGPVPPPAQEYTLAILVSRVRHVAAAPPALEVRFAFPRPAAVAEHVRVLGVEPAFGAAEAAVVLARATWDGPTRAADPGLFAALDLHARTLAARAAPQEDAVGLAPGAPSPRGAGLGRGQVRAAIGEELPGREPALAAVARRLGTSARTLQRRLAEEGTTFAALVDEVRRQRAEAFLAAPDVSIAEVSWLVGFAEQSAFTRAFRRWTGAAPDAWRKGRRTSAAR
jgi:AraC-like DNA-binding protein